MRSARHHHLHHLRHDHASDHRLHRSGRAAPWFVVAALALVAAVAAGCGGSDSPAVDAAGADPAGTAGDATAPLTDIFDTDFLVACDGVGFEPSTTYTPTPGAIHPVIVLAGEGTEMYGRSTAVREAWTRSWTAEAPLGLAEIELVACAERTAAALAQECTGYESDGVETDNVVLLNEVEYAVSLREAKTGAEVASTTITALDDECPMFVSFTEGEPTTEYYSFDDLALQAFLEPYVTP